MDLRYTVDGVVNVGCGLPVPVCHSRQVIILIISVAYLRAVRIDDSGKLITAVVLIAHSFSIFPVCGIRSRLCRFPVSGDAGDPAEAVVSVDAVSAGIHHAGPLAEQVVAVEYP